MILGDDGSIYVCEEEVKVLRYLQGLDWFLW